MRRGQCFRNSLCSISFAAMLMLASCGGATETYTESNLAELARTFSGIGGVERQSDGGWLISWSAVDSSSALYGVFRSDSEASMAYAEPLFTTSQNSYKYVSENVLSEPKRCFAVRIMGSSDTNTRIQCNDASPALFAGLSGLDAQSNGSYLLRWTKLSVDDAVYWIFQRGENQSYDFSQPAIVQSGDFYQTPVIERAARQCFVVRVVHVNYGNDSNQAELCTAQEDRIEPVPSVSASFDITKTVSDLTISWSASVSSAVVGYKIYLDWKCSIPASCDGTLTPGYTTSLSCKIVGWTRTQTQICVIAADSAGRESAAQHSLPIPAP
jgi:hypothetical protein